MEVQGKPRRESKHRFSLGQSGSSGWNQTFRRRRVFLTAGSRGGGVTGWNHVAGCSQLSQTGSWGQDFCPSSTALCSPDLTGWPQAFSYSHPLRSKTQHSETPNKVLKRSNFVDQQVTESFWWVKGEDDLCCLVCRIINSRADDSLVLRLNSSPAPSLLVSPPYLPLPLLFQAIPLSLPFAYSTAEQQPASRPAPSPLES